MTDEEIGKMWDANVSTLNTANVLAFARALEAHVAEQCGNESAAQQQELQRVNNILLKACKSAEWNSLDLPKFVVEELEVAIATARGEQ